MTRLRGRAARGQRVVDAVPQGHWKISALIAALDLRGLRCAMVLDGPVNGMAFQAFIAQVLALQLRPGDLVVMDNLSSHQGPRVAELIRAAQAEWVYLPPYSPDFSPIEPAFSQIKQALRSLAARAVDRLWRARQPVLDQITPRDAAGFFRHCGYATEIN